MSMPIGTLVGFLVPVFFTKILEDGQTNEERKIRIRSYLLSEALVAIAMFLLTFLILIPGHSKVSILKMIKTQNATDDFNPLHEKLVEDIVEKEEPKPVMPTGGMRQTAEVNFSALKSLYPRPQSLFPRPKSMYPKKVGFSTPQADENENDQ